MEEDDGQEDGAEARRTGEDELGHRGAGGEGFLGAAEDGDDFIGGGEFQEPGESGGDGKDDGENGAGADEGEGEDGGP